MPDPYLRKSTPQYREAEKDSTNLSPAIGLASSLLKFPFRVNDKDLGAAIRSRRYTGRYLIEDITKMRKENVEENIGTSLISGRTGDTSAIVGQFLDKQMELFINRLISTQKSSIDRADGRSRDSSYRKHTSVSSTRRWQLRCFRK